MLHLMRPMEGLLQPTKFFVSLLIKVTLLATIEHGTSKTSQKDMSKSDKTVTLPTIISSSLEASLSIIGTVESTYSKVFKTL